MTFDIRFLEEEIPNDWLHEGEQGLLAEIEIDGFLEKETILTGYWKKEDYLRQWQEAARLLTGDSSDVKAAFATSVHDPMNPEHGYVISWWTAYRVGDVVYIRNESLGYDANSQPIDIKNIYKYISDRNDSENVSEWQVSVEDIRKFGEELNQKF